MLRDGVAVGWFNNRGLYCLLRGPLRPHAAYKDGVGAPVSESLVLISRTALRSLLARPPCTRVPEWLEESATAAVSVVSQNVCPRSDM